MADPRVEAVAKILVDYSTEVKPNQLVRITGAPEGAPLLLAVYQRVLEHGANPWLQIGLDGAQELFFA
ncbi:MAG: aminopeptidase, partial [Dehalococcoidia bacterium]